MTRKKDPYHKYVEHPHFGRGPQITGSNPSVFDAGVSLRSDAISSKEFEALYRGKRHSQLLDELESPRVPRTAIMADQSKQPQNSYARVTHYFDLDKVCIECTRPFIFLRKSKNIGLRRLALVWIRKDRVASTAESGFEIRH